MPAALFAALLLFAAATDGVREAPPQPPPQAAKLTKLPNLTDFHAAVYPPAAVENGITADVRCNIDIDAAGAVSAVTVAQGAESGDAALDAQFNAAALEAIKLFNFAPAELDGKPAAVRIAYVYHFVLEKKLVPIEVAKVDPDAGSIEGKILEAGTRRPLTGAEVSLEESELIAITDGEGRFSLTPVSPGPHRVIVSMGAFTQGSARVKLGPKEVAQVAVYLRHSEPGELSATVRGDRQTDAPTVRSLSQEELRNVPGALNDPIRAVQNLPGLARAPFLSGALIVRGSAPADTGIYIDGDKVPIIFHFLGGPSILPDSMLDRIDFFPGGYGAYYGRNLTGTLDVTTRGGEGKGFHGEASIDLLQSSLFIEAPITDSTRISGSVRRSYIDVFLPLFLKADASGSSTSVVPVYYDYQLRLDHKFANGDTLDLFGFGSDDRLALVQTGPKLAQTLDVSTHIGLNRLHGTWRHSLSSELQLLVSPSIGQATTSFSTSGTGVGGAQGASQSGSIQDLSAGLRSELRWQVAPVAQLRFGFDSLFDRTNISANLTTSRNLVSVGTPQTESIHVTALEPFQQWGEYVESDIKLGRIEMVPGVRFDQLHARGNTQLSADPRFWTRESLFHDDSLKQYIGLYHQGPQPQQLLPQIGNPSLGVESAAQVGAGYERRFSDLWSASVEVFYNRQWGLVERVDATSSGGQLQNKIYDNVGIGRSFGMELLVRREITASLYGWLSYTLSKSQVLTGPGRQWTAFTYDQPHILTVVVGWRPSVGWELSGRFRYTSGDPYAPTINASFDADSGSYDPQRGQFGDSRSPAFTELDVRAQYTWTWDLFRLTLYLDIENVTNRKNEEFHVYDYRYRDGGSISGLPILPTLGVTGKW